ncbi:hypothetical protein [Azohydromonas australica]|uniref:hypothetical protein n=1 Tax=Azohydromonas australica TaxID=364039 RepID=UPI00040A5646|nr:hypothetical protein [Azohydromonas australica]
MAPRDVVKLKMKFQVLSLLSVALLAVSVSAQAHGRGEYKEEFWDGSCKVKRKYKDGGYKEERKCRAAAPVYYAPAPVYAPPPVHYRAVPVPVPVQIGLPMAPAGITINGTFHLR